MFFTERRARSTTRRRRAFSSSSLSRSSSSVSKSYTSLLLRFVALGDRLRRPFPKALDRVKDRVIDRSVVIVRAVRLVRLEVMRVVVVGDDLVTVVLVHELDAHADAIAGHVTSLQG